MKLPIRILAITLLISGCDSDIQSTMKSAASLASGAESDFTIQVTGTPGIKFSGSYMLMKADGSNTQKSVDGKTPSEYKLRGQIISTNFQKQGTKGELIAVILRDGKEVSRSDTTAAYGVVSVATR